MLNSNMFCKHLSESTLIRWLVTSTAHDKIRHTTPKRELQWMRSRLGKRYWRKTPINIVGYLFEPYVADYYQHIYLHLIDRSSNISHISESPRSTLQAAIYQCFSLMSTVLTSTPSVNHLSSSEIFTSFVLFCLFFMSPFSAKVQSSRP